VSKNTLGKKDFFTSVKENTWQRPFLSSVFFYTRQKILWICKCKTFLAKHKFGISSFFSLHKNIYFQNVNAICHFLLFFSTYILKKTFLFALTCCHHQISCEVYSVCSTGILIILSGPRCRRRRRRRRPTTNRRVGSRRWTPPRPR